MPHNDDQRWCPFRAGADDLKRIETDVSEIPQIQQKTLAENKALKFPDRVAHQYQIAGGKVMLKIAGALPAPLAGVGLFEPGSQHLGIGRLSTGLGTPHVEPNPDFLGLRVAFQTKAGQRVDFIAINDPASPADDHIDFMSILHATGESAGAAVPFVGDLGDRDLLNVAASQTVFATALVKRMGFLKTGKTMLHLMRQTSWTLFSSTAYQTYWTGIMELSGTAGKFALIPAHDENHWPGLHPGERLFSTDWKERQQRGDIEFRLFWIPFVDEEKTPTKTLTNPWQEDHKQFAGTVVFPQADLTSQEAQLWAILAAEMGANPGNWIANKENSINEPATEFGIARKLAYAASQKGRDALPPELYRSVFETGQIGDELALELRRRRDEKVRAGHVNQAP